MTSRSFFRVLFSVLAGAVIWAIHFTIVYGFTAVACARGLVDTEVLGTGVVPFTIAVVTGVAVLAAAVVSARALRPVRAGAPDAGLPPAADFIRWLTAAVAGLAVVVMILEALTAALVPACT